MKVGKQETITSAQPASRAASFALALLTHPEVLIGCAFVAAGVRLVATWRSVHGNGDEAAIGLPVRAVRSHPPLIGAFSRVGFSHPGPLLYYVLAPFYW